MKIYLIRHGRTDWNDTNQIQGKSNIPLNSTGFLQARRVAEELKQSDLHISHIYTSPLQRAHQTALIISDVLNLPCDVINALEEINLGDWEGLSWREVREQYPERYAIWHEDRRYTNSINGESYNDMLERVLPALQQLASSDKDVAVVTHSAVIMALMCYINNTPFEQMLSYKVKNVSITVIDSSQLFK